MTEATRPCANDEAAQEGWEAALLRDAHTRLFLWERCSGDACQRLNDCGGDADGCGARLAPESWPWLRHVVEAVLAGKSKKAAVEAANLARLGIRARRIVRWPGVPCWDPIEFVQLNDGTWVRSFDLPPRPPLDPQIAALVASDWLRSTLERWESQVRAQEQARPRNATARRAARRAKARARRGGRVTRVPPPGATVLRGGMTKV